MKFIQNNRGFTLIEILTAVFILSIMVSLVLGSFGSLFDDADHVNMGTDLHEMGSACLDRISNDLKSIHVSSYPRYRPPDIDDDPEIYHVKGETRNVGGGYFGWLRFTSLAHLPFNQSATEGIAEIVYYAQQTPANEIILRRADNLYPYPEEFEENETDPVMCEKVRKFELVYFDDEGDEHEEWDSESDDMEYSTPRAIGIKLSVGTEETSYAFTSRISLPAYRYKKVKK
jgi:general secretion pathway protein J